MTVCNVEFRCSTAPTSPQIPEKGYAVFVHDRGYIADDEGDHVYPSRVSAIEAAIESAPDPRSRYLLFRCYP